MSGLLELGRFDEARQRHVVVDSYCRGQGRHAVATGRASHLMRERQLATTTNAVRAVTVWMLAGMVLFRWAAGRLPAGGQAADGTGAGSRPGRRRNLLELEVLRMTRWDSSSGISTI